MNKPRRGRTTVAALVLVAAAVVPAISVGAMPRQQPAPASFTGTALAIGVQTSALLKGYLIVENLADPGVPYASAMLDSSGNSKAVAAYPFPGETAASAAPLVSGLLDIFSIPNPTAPVMAQADYPLRVDDERKDVTGYWHQVAHADTGRSSARSQGGAPSGAIGPVTESRSTVEVLDDGTVEAKASVAIEGLQAAGGLITIGRLRSESITRLEPGSEEPESTADLKIEGLRIGNLAIELLPSGDLSILGVNIPIPIGEGETLLNSVLRPLGVEVALIEPQPVEGGLRSQALKISATQQLPLDGNPPVIASILLGGATSAISATAAAAPPPVGTDTSDGAALVEGLPTGTDNGLAMPDLPALPGGAPAAGGASSEVPTSEGGRLVAAVDLSSAFFELYLVAVVAAVVLAVGTSVLRNHALRAVWTRRASDPTDRSTG